MSCWCTPQGSVLGRLPSPISTAAQLHQVHQQQYTDDAQLYVALWATNYRKDITPFQSCLNSLHIRCGANIYRPKSHWIICYFVSYITKAPISASLNSVNVTGAAIPLSDNVWFQTHNGTFNSCFYHIWSFNQIHSSLYHSMVLSVFHCTQIKCIPSCTALCWSTWLAFSKFKTCWPESWCISAPTYLLCHLLHSLKSSTGFQLNGTYSLNLPLWPSRQWHSTGHPPYHVLQQNEPTRSPGQSCSH